MNRLIIDNSIVLKWFYKENDSDKALELLELIHDLNATLILPSLAVVELVNSLKFGKKTDSLKADDVIKKFFALEPKLLSLDLESSLKLSLIVHKNNITSYDACYILAAEELNIPIFTADYKHHKKTISKNIVWLKEWRGKL
mgnify:CR=1 FL=1